MSKSLITHWSEQEKQSLSELVFAITEGRADVPDLIQAMLPIVSGDLPFENDQALALSTALNEIEFRAQQEDQLYSIVNNHSVPSLLLSDAGTLIAVNETASQQFSVMNGDSFVDLGLSDADFEALKNRLESSEHTTLVRIEHRQVSGPEVPQIMIARYHHSLKLIVMTALEHRWTHAIDQAMADLFGLTVSERDILSQMARGLTAEQIAQNRVRSVGTIRQQIKAVLSKVGASNQVQAATMAAAAAQALISDPQKVNHNPTSSSDLLHSGAFYVQGRRVGWREYGDPSGHPVLLFHGPFFGMGCYQHERHLAAQAGLRIIGIERAGFGRTDPPHNTKMLVECHVSDTVALLERLDIDRVTVFSHDNGIIPAVCFAAQYPDRVRSMVGVSAPPLFHSLAQTNLMPSKQRLFVWAAQHAPWMVRLLIRVGMVQMRKLGPEHWMEAAFGEVPNEMEVVDLAMNHEGNTTTYAFNIQQNGRGLEFDLLMTAVNWQPWLQHVACPLVLLHGRQNLTSEPSFVLFTADASPQVAFRWQEQAGQTLLLSHCEWVYDQLKQAISD